MIDVQRAHRIEPEIPFSIIHELSIGMALLDTFIPLHVSDSYDGVDSKARIEFSRSTHAIASTMSIEITLVLYCIVEEEGRVLRFQCRERHDHHCMHVTFSVYEEWRKALWLLRFGLSVSALA